MHSPNCTLAGTLRMVRARASAAQGLGGRRLLDGHETFPLQAFEHVVASSSPLSL